MSHLLLLLVAAIIGSAVCSTIDFKEEDSSVSRHFHVHSEPMHQVPEDLLSKRPFVEFEGGSHWLRDPHRIIFLINPFSIIL